MPNKPQRRRSSTDVSIRAEIDAAVDGWVADGVVEATGWRGRPHLVTPIPEGCRFDADRVGRVIEFFANLVQQKGRWAGKQFRLLDWQVRWEIGPVFGVVRDDGRRQFRTAWIEKPRKNGKSTECSGLGLYLWCADREPGAEVYAAAGDKPQAGIVFDAARRMAESSKIIVDRVGMRGLQRGRLEHPHTGAVFRALSSDGARQHGLNVHGAIIDEVHVHKKPDLIEALETGTGSREQPLVVFITTADAGDDGSIYATKREYLEGIVGGSIVDESFYGVVFAMNPRRKGYDPFSEADLRAANPGIGYTTSLEYLQRAANKARQSPSELNGFLRLHGGIRTKQVTRWLTLQAWDRAAGMAVPDVWQDAIAFGGLDLSTTTDLTSFVLVTGGPEGLDVHPMFWLPQDSAIEFERRFQMPLGRWAREGWLRLTDGNVVDYAQVRADIVDTVAGLGCSVAAVGYDPWNATETVQELERAGFVMVPVRQGYGALSGPAKQVERLVVGSTPAHPMLRHGGHPVLRWNADCVEVRSDDNGNIKPVKPDRLKSSKRIDGVVALIMAVGQWMVTPELEESSAAAYLEALSTR